MNGRKITGETDLEKKILDVLIEHPEEKLEKGKRNPLLTSSSPNYNY